MSIITSPRKGTIKVNNDETRSTYMTTTELSRLCGVSRFTVINWVKQGKIKANRTVGNHYRIPASEALSLLRTFDSKKKISSSELKELCRQQSSKTNVDEERGNCLTGNKKKKQLKSKKKNVLYAFGYGIGRGVHVLKGRSKHK